VQAHALVAVLLEPEAAPHRGAWVAHAERVSARRLSDDVAKALAAGEYEPGRADPDCESLQTGASSRSRGETARLFFAAAPEVAHLFRATLATVQRRWKMATLGDALDAMLEHALAEWSAPPNREHRVFERDGWRCTCARLLVVSQPARPSHRLPLAGRLGRARQPHHAVRVASPARVHAGVVRCTGQAPDALHFELGRPPVLVFGPGEVRMPS
jgi:hypothetical protein